MFHSTNDLSSDWVYQPAFRPKDENAIIRPRVVGHVPAPQRLLGTTPDAGTQTGISETPGTSVNIAGNYMCIIVFFK